MRIESIELTWFRGAGTSVILNPLNKSLVVYGTNGAGKSTFADAFEYIVSKGKIRHLSHEYSGYRQRMGLRNTHAPDGVPSILSVRFQGNAWLKVTIKPNGTFSVQCEPKSLKDVIQSWSLESFIMRQDEVARFIHAQKGEKYSVLMPVLGLEPMENAAVNLRSLQKALTVQIDLNQKRQHLDGLRQTALEHLPDLSPEMVNWVLEEMAQAYLPSGFDGDQVTKIAAVEQAIQDHISRAEPEQRRYMLLEQIQYEQLGNKLAALEQAELTADLVTSEFIDRRIAVLEPTQEFLKTLETDIQMVECPACGQEIAVSQFASHVKGELQELTHARDARKKVIQARQQLQVCLSRISNLVLEDDFLAWVNLPKQGELKDSLNRLDALRLDRCEQHWDQSIWEILRHDIPLTCAIIDKTIDQAPPSTRTLFRDAQVIDAIIKIPEVYSYEQEIQALDIVIQYLGQAEIAVRETIKSRTRIIMDQVSGSIQQLWSELHPEEPIEKVELYIPRDAEKAIDICLKYYGVDQPSPRLTLSEGHRNSLGLCIFLALVGLEKDKNHPIILDDVVSSLDREHRGRLTGLLKDYFAEQQIILLTHDREWYAELRSRLPAHQWDFLALRPWENPKIGIQWSQSKDTFDDARSLVSINPEAAGNRTRAIMDTHLAIYAERLKIRVPFSRGDRNDRRTCIEFLGRIISEAKGKLRKRNDTEWVVFPDPINEWKEARSLLVSWGNRASHSGSLTTGEVVDLIKSCERSLLMFRCSDCKEPVWYADQGTRERMQCRCGELVWKYG